MSDTPDDAVEIEDVEPEDDGSDVDIDLTEGEDQ